ncbi:hypothetical protein CONLIGDRAFT_651543 [Coniochaeta ligniaria NRRL 30616]|uniref:NodB homology domain-containing protein n=1 Tax=Coniochaeta ligniaria NRRL 30616 TaxID=1408157 RepID=A0A1J7K1F5_9PEZI|nr:hypothetical protein CONLIGDRAFT_651543 [Coniochaeta ligniaria NRRL 30616]
MTALQRGLCIALLLWHGVIASPLGQQPQQHPLQSHAAAPRKLKGKFLHITDLHPDEFYKVHSSTSEEDTCHRGKGPAGTYGAETSDCDSPLSLVNATFDWISANLKDEIDFVIWTGDSARHDSDEDIPRSPAQVLGTNRLVADKFADTFSDPSGVGMTIPVIPTLGNNDILPHNILLPGPNKWLKYYTDIWRHFIPEEQRHSFEFGGWFYVEVIPNKLAVFSLNTLYFFDRNAGVDDCTTPSEPGYKQMEWLRIQLQFLRSRGMKAILMGHVPPARTESKKLWDETCWQKYTLWLQQYRDVVTGGIFGHMNIDHFMLQDTKDVDIGVVTGSSTEFGAREAMDDELSAESTADYLQELRIGWSNLVKPTSGGAGDEGHKKGKKPKKPRDPWAERYQLSLVGPSIVPNYFPTLRVVEYNISGLENAAVWSSAIKSISDASPIEEDEERNLELRDLSEVEASKKGDKKQGRKKKHHKKPKDKKPKDPNLVIPQPPAETSPPGPAYSPQPLTLTGYTQYFANLTHINNDLTPDDGGDENTEPKKSKPKPREFVFEVEYRTKDDKLYKLEDLTVGSFVKLASLMAQPIKGKGFEEGLSVVGGGNDTLVGEEQFEDEDGLDDEADSDDESDDEVEAAKKNGKNGKHKKKKHGGKHKKKKANKVWLHFLSHAFVKTIDEDDLKKMIMALHLLLLLLVLLLVLPAYIIYKPPKLLIRYFAHRWPDVLFEAFSLPASAGKVIALTIDDAPSSHTRDILQVLADEDAHATFFVVGNQVSGREDVLQEIVTAGHGLGNHGGRDEPARGLTLSELQRQITAVEGVIETAYDTAGVGGKDRKETGRDGKYFRPGSGFFSSKMRELAKEMGYRIVLGGIYPHDAQIGYEWVNARHILGMVRPGGIIICHDRRSWTVGMLRRVLPELRRRGYRVVGVGELTWTTGHYRYWRHHHRSNPYNSPVHHCGRFQSDIVSQTHISYPLVPNPTHRHPDPLSQLQTPSPSPTTPP